MGSRAEGKRLLVIPLIAALLAMLLAPVPALAAQSSDQVPQYSAPVDQHEPGPPGNTPVVCEHAPGEFLVGYTSEEAMKAAPPESVVETFAVSSRGVSPSRR